MIKYFSIVALFAVIVLFGCAPNPFRDTNKIYKQQAKALAKTLRKAPPEDSVNNAAFWAGTTNFNMRKPNFVIIHHTAQNSCEQTLQTFTKPVSQVSAHYVICKDGAVHHMLNDYFRAWQAGVSRWGNSTDINSNSIGIELDNNGFEPFSETQINSLIALLGRLKRAYNIPAANFIGHSDIAPGRKVDPNRYFPWQLLAQNGYGLWFDTTGVVLPPVINPVQSLRIIGYDVRDSARAMSSFKLHFVQNDSSNVLTTDDLKILYDLSKRYQ